MSSKVESKEASLRWVQVLPGAKALLFTDAPATGSYDTANIVAFSLTDRTRKVVVQGGYQARYVRAATSSMSRRARSLPRRSISTRSRCVAARFRPFKAWRPIPQAVGAQFAVSHNGTVVYVAGETTADKAPIRWIDRTGKTEMLAKHRRGLDQSQLLA